MQTVSNVPGEGPEKPSTLHTKFAMIFMTFLICGLVIRHC
jgi:hypothetical protein